MESLHSRVSIGESPLVAIQIPIGNQANLPATWRQAAFKSSRIRSLNQIRRGVSQSRFSVSEPQIWSSDSELQICSQIFELSNAKTSRGLSVDGRTIALQWRIKTFDRKLHTDTLSRRIWFGERPKFGSSQADRRELNCTVDSIY